MFRSEAPRIRFPWLVQLFSKTNWARSIDVSVAGAGLECDSQPCKTERFLQTRGTRRCSCKTNGSLQLTYGVEELTVCTKFRE